MKVPQMPAAPLDRGVEHVAPPFVVALARRDLGRHGVEVEHPSERRAAESRLGAGRPQQRRHGPSAQAGQLVLRQVEGHCRKRVQIPVHELPARVLRLPVRGAEALHATRGARFLYDTATRREAPRHQDLTASKRVAHEGSGGKNTHNKKTTDERGYGRRKGAGRETKMTERR